MLGFKALVLGLAGGALLSLAVVELVSAHFGIGVWHLFVGILIAIVIRQEAIR